MKISFENISTSTIIKAGVVIVVLVIIGSLLFSNYQNSYKHKVETWRRQNDLFLKNDEGSPIIDKEKFKGLSYFEPNSDYKVNAHLSILHDTTPLTMLRTDGEKEQFQKYAIATFLLNEKEYQLTLFKSTGKNEKENILFVPFTDKTNEVTTYKAGRYLNIEVHEEDEVEIDFNYAYNPFCAYNQRYSCPIPPKENDLDIEIPVGERMPEKTP